MNFGLRWIQIVGAQVTRNPSERYGATLTGRAKDTSQAGLPNKGRWEEIRPHDPQPQECSYTTAEFSTKNFIRWRVRP